MPRIHSTEQLPSPRNDAPLGAMGLLGLRLLGSGATGPNFQMKVDGWVLTGGGYKLWNFVLSLDETNATDKHWHLKLALMRMPKAQLR
jgi:hypothetical protein